MKKFVFVCLTALLSLSVIFAFTACGEEPKTEYDFTFTGSITLGDSSTDSDVKYDIKMTGKNGAFKLCPNELTPLRGTYTFSEGKGYTFSFNDADGTDVRTTWDASKKEFSFIYTLDLGEARGKGNIKLTCKDEKFTQSGDAWAGIPTFLGISDAMVHPTYKVVCKADGTFRAFSTDFGAYVTEKEGTYVFEDGVYKFTIGEQTFSSTVNAQGLHEVDVPFALPALSYTQDCHCVQVVLTVD